MAFKRWQKSPSKKGIQKAWSNLEMKVISWCLNNGIKIAVIPSGIDWQVELNINDKIHLNPEVYKAKEAYEKMYEYYKYYYDKRNK